MAKNLVIVESPSKAKTIGKYLGKDFLVKASVGHIKDLPAKTLGVDLEHNFQPTYQTIPGKEKVIQELKTAAQNSDSVYLATDPDREGEAIAWHIAEEIRQSATKPKRGKKKKTEEAVTEPSNQSIHRVLFNEITQRSVREAIQNPKELNEHLFDAQQARRILDRLVGYKISPLLWDKVQRGLSAGRVQSVAVRIICEREAEIENFKPVEYWSLDAKLEGSNPPLFVARFVGKSGKKVEIHTEEETRAIEAAVRKFPFVLREIQRKERRRFPTPPFITSKLQQEAARKLGFTAKKTMMLAQKLYEGIELEGGEIVGLITYMRTDSTRLSNDSLQELRGYIQTRYGKDFLPEQPVFYKSKKSAQDAHEAIRPTSIQYEPEAIKRYLSSDEYKLYELIWKRFVACQMNPAIYDQTTFNIQAQDYDFRATGSILKFPGFIAVYTEGKDETDSSEDDKDLKLPNVQEGETLKLHDLISEQHFTQPPPRFTEASLVKELEEKGIGRPSTYASILSVIQEKKYAIKEEGKFKPSELGRTVNKLLTENFPEIINVEFTAKMEEELDEVEEGTRPWTKSLSDFYGTFDQTLQRAKVQMKNLKKEEIATEFTCEKCGSPMVIKWGRHGQFMACSGYPECKNTKEIQKSSEGGGYQPLERKDEPTDEVCVKCGSPMVMKRGRFGNFLACSKYPDCKTTKAVSIGVNCPDCGSPISERRSKRGKVFYGCTGYPNCKFALWDKPINETCPDCGSKYLLVKYSKKDGEKVKCPNKECKYERQKEAS